MCNHSTSIFRVKSDKQHQTDKTRIHVCVIKYLQCSFKIRCFIPIQRMLLIAISVLFVLSEISQNIVLSRTKEIQNIIDYVFAMHFIIYENENQAYNRAPRGLMLMVQKSACN